MAFTAKDVAALREKTGCGMMDCKKALTASNVLVLKTDISVISGDTAGRMKARLTGEGEGLYLCGGKSIHIRWSKADRNHPFVYTREDGTPLALEQGRSYVCIVSARNAKVSVT